MTKEADALLKRGSSKRVASFFGASSRPSVREDAFRRVERALVAPEVGRHVQESACRGALAAALEEGRGEREALRRGAGIRDGAREGPGASVGVPGDHGVERGSKDVVLCGEDERRSS